MKTINLNIVNEKIYYDKLHNGLEIYISYNKDYKNNYATYLTNFGGRDTEFIPYGQKDMVKVPTGIAHFLEHKLFEQEDGESVHDFYKKTGTYDNASTDSKYTRYIINGPFNFKENLAFLLEYVNSPYFTDKNVEKEKGIILEEESMGKDNPNRLFFETINKNLFNSKAYQNSVIGTRKDIKSITKEELYTCYNTFYHPSNMVLFVSTNEKPEDIINIVKRKVKTDKKDFKIVKKEYDEEEKARVKKEVLHNQNVTETRICYSLKYKVSDFNASKDELNYYYKILLSLLVGELSDFNLDLKKNKIIKDDIYFDVSFEKFKNDEFMIISIITLTNKTNEFVKLLEEQLMKKDYKKEEFELYKKDIKADLTWNFNSQVNIMFFMQNSYSFDKKIDNDRINLLEKLNFDRFKEVTNKLSLNNKSIVILKK